MPDQPDLFLSEEEIVTDMLLYRLAEHEKITLRGVPPADIRQLCSELADAIIKHYRLDDGHNPYVNQSAVADNTPVNVAYHIVEKVWSRLTGKAVPVFVSEIIDNGDGTYMLNGAIVYSNAAGTSAP
jgi:L-lysine 2,3-aminomutase